MKSLGFLMVVAFVAVLSACVLETEPPAEPEFVEVVGVVMPEPEPDWEAEYDVAVVDWAETYGYSDEWVEWMLANRSRYINGFRSSRTQTDYRVGFVYMEDSQINYSPAWVDEEEHMQALEQISELTYAGWSFDFIFAPEEDDEVDLTVYANYDGMSHCCGGEAHDSIWLHWETIFMHEFSHFVRVHHHYSSMETAGRGENMPPGETICLMDRTAVQFCSACSFALGIPPLSPEEILEIKYAIENIRTRYPADFQ
jgi:hypothetical protein